MKIKGQHGEFDREGTIECPHPATKRQIEIDENERISIRVKNRTTGEEEEIMSFFMPGVLTLSWEYDTPLKKA